MSELSTSQETALYAPAACWWSIFCNYPCTCRGIVKAPTAQFVFKTVLSIVPNSVRSPKHKYIQCMLSWVVANFYSLPLKKQLPFWRNLPQLVSWIFPATNTGISCCVLEVRRLIVRLFPYLSLTLLRFEAHVCTFTSRQICHFHGNSMSTNTDQLTSSPNKLLFHIDRRTYSCIGHPKAYM